MVEREQRKKQEMLEKERIRRLMVRGEKEGYGDRRWRERENEIERERVGEVGEKRIR